MTATGIDDKNPKIVLLNISKFSWELRTNWINFSTYTIMSGTRFGKYLRYGWSLYLPNINIYRISSLNFLKYFEIQKIKNNNIIVDLRSVRPLAE